MDFKFNFDNIFNSEHFKKSVWITFLFMSLGFLILFICLVLADQVTEKKSLFYFLFQNIGIISFFISLLIAYAGVHRINSNTIGSDLSVKQAFTETIKKTHYIIMITLGVFLSICIVASIEFGVSYISNIPYAGPAIISLLTIPFFMLIFLSLILSLCFFILTPPMVSDGKSIKEIVKDFRGLIKTKGLYIIVYSIVSMIFFFFCLKMVYYIAGYSTGITKAMQWKINIAYPKLLDIVIKQSYLTDILGKIAPKTNTMDALQKYGLEILDYVAILKYIIGFSYYAVYTFIFAIPFAAFFNITSNFYKKIKE